MTESGLRGGFRCGEPPLHASNDRDRSARPARARCGFGDGAHRIPAPGAPRVAIFYYPWYGTPARDGSYAHWEQGGRKAPLDIASGFYPARGIYSSSNPRVVRAQMREIRAAGIDEVATSWWGWGSYEDERLPLVLTEASRAGLAVSIHLEPYLGRTAESVASDIEHLRSFGVTDFYIYQPLDLPAEDWAALNDSLDSSVRLFAATSMVGFAAAAHFDGVYTYDIVQHPAAQFARLCAQAHASGLVCAPSVGPGFDARRATGDDLVKPRRSGATYDLMWSAALAAGADKVTITSYNEWHEGTQIEPAHREPAALGYACYDGAWGFEGRSAQRSYLRRTAYWSGLFHAGLYRAGLRASCRRSHSLRSNPQR